MTAVELVTKAIKIFKDINGLPKEIIELRKKMESIRGLFVSIQGFVKINEKQPLMSLLPDQRKELAKGIKRIQKYAKETYLIFERYKKDVLSRPAGPSKWSAQAWYSVIDRTPDKIKELLEKIQEDNNLLVSHVQLMTAQGVSMLVQAQQTTPAPPLAPQFGLVPQQGRPARNANNATTNQSPLTRLNQQTLSVPRPAPGRNSFSNLDRPATLSPVIVAAEPKRPSSTPPSTSAPNTLANFSSPKYKVLFVDPYGTERSVIARSLARLLFLRTIAQGRGDQCRIGELASAGFFVRDNTNRDCVNLIERMDYVRPSYRRDIMDAKTITASSDARSGGIVPGVLDALSDDKSPAVANLLWGMSPTERTNIIRGGDPKGPPGAMSPIRGMQKSFFTGGPGAYDFIVVFTQRELHNVNKLKETILGPDNRVSEDDKAANPRKPWVVHLGAYGWKDYAARTMTAIRTHPRDAREIYVATEGNDYSDSSNNITTRNRGPAGEVNWKERWDLRVAQIRKALESFLSLEMGMDMRLPVA